MDRRGRYSLEDPACLRRARPASRRVGHMADLEPVELTGRAQCVRSHVIKTKPISYPERSRQQRHWAHAINRIAGGPPDAARVQRLGRRDVERPVEGQDVWVHLLMIEQDAVEGTVHAVIDVVCARESGRP